MKSQNLAVQDFHMDIMDLTANTAGTIVMDQNAQKCALIKVETIQTGFSFDCGSLGIVKTEQHVGEIYLHRRPETRPDATAGRATAHRPASGQAGTTRICRLQCYAYR